MAGTVVVAAGCGGQPPVDGLALARSVRELADAGWGAVVVTPPDGADLAGRVTLGLGQSRAGRRAVTVAAHVLIDPLFAEWITALRDEGSGLRGGVAGPRDAMREIRRMTRGSPGTAFS